MAEPLHDVLFHKAPICVIDFETTGLSSNAKAVEVALVRFEKGVRVGYYSSFIDPGMEIPAEASAIHGITKEHVTGAPDIVSFFKSTTARGMLAGAQPCAYNASYDRRFMPWGDALWCVMEKEWRWLDPMIWVKEMSAGNKELKNNLEAACGRYGVQLDGAHRALSDATATGHLLYALVERIGCREKTIGAMLADMSRNSWSGSTLSTPTKMDLGLAMHRLKDLVGYGGISYAAYEVVAGAIKTLPELEAAAACWDAQGRLHEAMGTPKEAASRQELTTAVERLQALRTPPAEPVPLCIECHEPQFQSPGGMTCRNGHGGAEAI